ncbi:MAG: ABC transporter permease [Thermoplasmata archaeon]|nr:MAG: ABC transporter permease [Thermoplasmata archaeon]HDJ27421.1 ABC transporter permease [Aciduliprofundum sp.]
MPDGTRFARILPYRVRLEPRVEVPRTFEIQVRILAILLSLAIMTIVFLSLHINPISAFKAMFLYAFGKGILSTLSRAMTLVLIAIGLSMAFRSLFWNIGAEGQYLVGAITAFGIGRLFPNLSGYALIPLMLLGGFAAGALYGQLPAILKVKLKVNEVITTLMLNYIAIRLLYYLVYGPWNVKEVVGGVEYTGYAVTNNIPYQAQLSTVGNSTLSYAMMGLVAVFLIAEYLIMERTPLGYDFKVIGDNPEAARYAGMRFLRLTMILMLLSGGLAGLAGAGELMANQHRLRPGFASGFGFTAIIIAWLGGTNPIGILLAGIFIAGIIIGGYNFQISTGLPVGFVGIFQGVLLFSVLFGEFLRRYKVKFERW